jgi:hypothetical protein
MAQALNFSRSAAEFFGLTVLSMYVFSDYAGHRTLPHVNRRRTLTRVLPPAYDAPSSGPAPCQAKASMTVLRLRRMVRAGPSAANHLPSNSITHRPQARAVLVP